MLDNTRNQQRGFTTAEIMAALIIGGIILVTFFVFSFTVLSNTVRNSNEAKLAVESQTILRSITEEIRTSSGVRSSNTVDDPDNPSGWTTSNPDLVLIISTPVINSTGDYVPNHLTGMFHQNEIVYYADGNRLYKRILADDTAADNQMTTSCPEATNTCPQDILLSENFKTMNFVFYNQDDELTNDPLTARSINITIHLERTGYGQTTKFDNTIRVTMRNNVI